MVYLDAWLGCDLIVLILLQQIQLVRRLLCPLLLILMCLLLEVLLIICHHLNNLITKVICVIYLFDPVQFATRIPCRMLGIFVSLRLYRAIMILKLGVIFVILMPIPTLTIFPWQWLRKFVGFNYLLLVFIEFCDIWLDVSMIIMTDCFIFHKSILLSIIWSLHLLELCDKDLTTFRNASFYVCASDGIVIPTLKLPKLILAENVLCVGILLYLTGVQILTHISPRKFTVAVT